MARVYAYILNAFYHLSFYYWKFFLWRYIKKKFKSSYFCNRFSDLNESKLFFITGCGSTMELRKFFLHFQQRWCHIGKFILIITTTSANVWQVSPRMLIFTESYFWRVMFYCIWTKAFIILTMVGSLCFTSFFPWIASFSMEENSYSILHRLWQLVHQ